ncbi:RNase P/RNase MRP complex subunit [Binucleata daphniae]
MLYDKIVKTTFSASEYYTTYTNNTYHHTFPFFTPMQPKKEKKRKIAKTQRYLTYEEYLKINKMHIAYLKELKGGMNSDNFLPVLYKAELTGAMIECKKEKYIVIEERMNVLKVINSKNEIKMIIKKYNNFTIESDGSKYIIFGTNMNSNRFYKK